MTMMTPDGAFSLVKKTRIMLIIRTTSVYMPLILLPIILLISFHYCKVRMEVLLLVPRMRLVDLRA